MKKITSPANPEVRSVVSLQQAKNRYTQRRFIAQGIRTLSGLIASGKTPLTIYATEKMISHAQALASPETTIRSVSESVMKKLSTATTPSGILGVFELPEQPDFTPTGPGLVLAHIADPGNMGTLIRTAAALNITTIICIQGADPWGAKVIQASAGTIGAVALFRMTWDELVAAKASFPLCALVTPEHTAALPIESARCSNGFLVVGSEAHGLPEEYITSCDQKLTIAMPGKAESLNAAVAGSLAAYLLFKPS